MSVATEVTEVDVIKAAIEQVRRRDGFTDSSYFRDTDGEMMTLSDVNGRQVGATCAVGGVEHALYKLTGEIVSARRHKVAGVPVPKIKGRTDAERLYVCVMARANRIAREMFPVNTDSGDPNRTVEEVTFYGSQEASRRRVAKVFRAALEEAQTSA